MFRIWYNYDFGFFPLGVLLFIFGWLYFCPLFSIFGDLDDG